MLALEIHFAFLPAFVLPHFDAFPAHSISLSSVDSPQLLLHSLALCDGDDVTGFSVGECAGGLTGLSEGELMGLFDGTEEELSVGGDTGSFRGGMIILVTTGCSVGAELTGAVLTGAALTGAVLIGAALTGAVLIGAELIGAALTGAELMGAELIGAALTGAELIGEELIGAVVGSYVGESTGLCEGDFVTGDDETGDSVVGEDVIVAVVESGLSGVGSVGFSDDS